MASALVVGNMTGSGVFPLPSPLAEHGPISLIAWGFTATGAMLLALVFARLARACQRTGGPYAYARRTFGDFVGFQTAWGYRIAVWAGNAAIAVASVGYLARFRHALATDRILAAGVGPAAVWSLTAVNAYGVRQAGAVQVVTTVVRLAPPLLVAVGGLFFVKSGNSGEFNAGGGSARRTPVPAAGDHPAGRPGPAGEPGPPAQAA
ncbi:MULTISPECIES: amino acid permease [Actinomadura]|uniref:Amino acid permease n=1 Tax=Actinomadura litoris TaxID=2678616 RepID=A0A7K1L5U3_9ACTN|nr:MULTISPECIES: amino acid permease [Actinomadura]MBT2212687.1 amino acid permease [Actinomadura sp. NEAU-AAG7]MUN39663.1 amino acid permease [Actinomadura litoris]